MTDLNYSTLLNFSEMDFVVPGPGARDGLRKCFSDLGGLNEAEMIKMVAERQQAEFGRLGIEFFSLWGRPLQLIDCCKRRLKSAAGGARKVLHLPGKEDCFLRFSSSC